MKYSKNILVVLHTKITRTFMPYQELSSLFCNTCIEERQKMTDWAVESKKIQTTDLKIFISYKFSPENNTDTYHTFTANAFASTSGFARVIVTHDTIYHLL